MNVERTTPGQMTLTFGGALADGTPLDVVATVLHDGGGGGGGGRAVTAVSLDSIRRRDDQRRVVGTPRLREAFFRRATWHAGHELASPGAAGAAGAADGNTGATPATAAPL
jgi:hypothetical protein